MSIRQGDKIIAGVIAGADRELSNLTYSGRNMSNWSSNITNCITELSQDINLVVTEKNIMSSENGVPILKSGSSVYIHKNGSWEKKTFDTDMRLGDDTIELPDGSRKLFLVYNEDTNTLVDQPVGNTFCQNTQPETSKLTDGHRGIWYNPDTQDVKCTQDYGETWNTCSLPICVGNPNTSDNWIGAIESVFNGFGYMGSTVFALPGVTGLIPNGRNTDGSLRSTRDTNETVLLKTYTTESITDVWFSKQANGINGLSGVFYDTANNYLIEQSTGEIQQGYIFATANVENGRITNFALKIPFRAFDQNDLATFTFPNMDMVIESKTDIYSVASKSWYRKYKSGWLEQGGTCTIDNDSRGGRLITMPKPFVNTGFEMYATVSKSDVPGAQPWEYYTIRCDTSYGGASASISLSPIPKPQYYVYVSWYACGQGAQ